MRRWPLVSVIVPTLNAVGTIRQALDSILWQKYPNLEVIVVDDGSNDGTVETILEYRNPSIHLLQQRQMGPAVARNLGLSRARGVLVSFLDADDIWLPGKLFLQVDYLQSNPDVDVVFGRFERWMSASRDAAPVTEMPSPSTYDDLSENYHRLLPARTTALCGFLYVDMLLESQVHIITAMVRRSVLENCGGFDEQWQTGSDYELWLRLSRLHRMDQLDACLAWYRIHDRSITKRPRAQNSEYLLVQKAVSTHGLQGPDGREVSPDALSRRLHAIAFGHGYMLFGARHLTWAHRCFSQAIGHLAWHPKTWIYWFLTMPASFYSRLKGCVS